MSLGEILPSVNAVLNGTSAVLLGVLARKSRFVEHRKIAKITFPVWMYVSVTGVVVYVMRYHLA